MLITIWGLCGHLERWEGCAIRQVKKILVYIEGEGGGDKGLRRSRRDGEFRQAWRAFLDPLVKHANDKGIRHFTCVPGTDGKTTLKDFKNELRLQDGALRIVMVDSEKPVDDDSKPWLCLGETPPKGVGDEHCYLIVQCLETWLVADLEKVAEHYDRTKKCFDPDVFPAWQELEKADRKRLQGYLESATSGCGRENRYGHASGNFLIAKVRYSELHRKLSSVRRLFKDFASAIDKYAEI